MKKILVLLSFIGLLSIKAFAGPGDTIRVHTFTFGSPQDAWFVFPSDTVRFEKILMKYTLKCNPAQSPACGEWDYLTYSYLYDHTGLLDSTLTTQATYLLNGSSPDTVAYITSPSYTYNTSWQYNVVYTNTVSVNNYTVGTGNTASNHPLGSSMPVSRSQYLWKASEMTSAGIQPGNITGIQLFLQSLGSELKNFTVRLKATTLDSLTKTNFNNTSYTTVYSHDRLFTSTGWNTISFNTPFNWNGTSNLIVEIMYDNETSGIDNMVESSATAFKSGLVNAGNDRCVKFHTTGFIDAPVNAEAAAIDSFVTVSFWAYGDPAYQPMAGTCFEGVTSNGTRVLNSHTPWSDGKVYWDAGNSNGYDRIIKTFASQNLLRGVWNHWAFTKQISTGIMKTYLNGAQIQSASGLFKAMTGLDQFRIGKGTWNGSMPYEGKMDQFYVFNTDLNLAAVQSLYRDRISASHPNYNNLVMAYEFNDGNYSTAVDASPVAHAPATFNEGADNPLKASTDLVSNFTEVMLRPNIIFEQGVYTSHLDSTLVVDSVMNAPMQLITYLDSINNPGLPTDTIRVWAPYYGNYIYDSQGNAIDSHYVAATDTLILDHYTYYNKFPQVIRYELGRYITPYGNGLSLGNGWTWTFDVSDYRTLLADSVHIAAGNWQELLDMEFLMIEGIPPRDVLDIENIYTGGFDYGHSNDPIETHLVPKTMNIPANAATTRWKSRVTGHGMDTPQNCAEFCPKFHYYKVDGVQRYSQLVWRDNCDLNPLYPQGGTWVYDRANWCPGAEVWTYDFELTPYVTPGTTTVLDHDVQAYTNNGEWSYYQIEDQLVSYSAPNFTNDAAVEDILSPSTNQMWLRYNPICNNPVIRIKNTGSANLTSLTITYGVTGATPSVYNWVGNLGFTKTEEVTLSAFATIPGATDFYVTVSDPNGTADEYSFNNTMHSAYQFPPVFPSLFVIELKTNNVPSENYYTLKDINGTTVFQRSSMTANTTYKDTLNLPDGCYTFDLRDNGEDGLSWWANTGQGNGTILFRNATSGSVLKNYNPDFGGQVYQQFTTSATVGISDFGYSAKNSMSVYPNPNVGRFTVNIDLQKRSDVELIVTDLLGKTIKEFKYSSSIAESVEVDLGNSAKGVYIVTLKCNNERISKKVFVQ